MKTKRILSVLAGTTVAMGLATQPNIGQAHAATRTGLHFVVRSQAKQMISHLVVPDGNQITLDAKHPYPRPITWKNMQVQLEVIGVAADHPYQYALVGNHSEIVSESFVQIPAGEAYFVVNKRTPSAADSSGPTTYEYWVAIYKPAPGRPDMKWAYTLKVTANSASKSLQQQVLKLAQRWSVSEV